MCGQARACHSRLSGFSLRPAFTCLQGTNQGGEQWCSAANNDGGWQPKRGTTLAHSLTYTDSLQPQQPFPPTSSPRRMCRLYSQQPQQLLLALAAQPVRQARADEAGAEVGAEGGGLYDASASVAWRTTQSGVHQQEEQRRQYSLGGGGGGSAHLRTRRHNSGPGGAGAPPG